MYEIYLKLVRSLLKFLKIGFPTYCAYGYRLKLLKAGCPLGSWK